MNTLNKLTCYSILCVTMGMTLLTAYWQLYPYNVITFVTPDNFPLLKTTYKAGEKLEYEVDVFQLTNNVKVDVTKQIECSERIINLPSSTYITMKGEQKFINSSVTIPFYTEPGPCKLVNVSQYHINPLRVITITRTSAEFNIIK